ncbi:PilN domain-containing protein [Geothrix edaphica]|uniref:PilN domain-containing protein n=1 Tax=Geothrix edaphica TaxID=2927976 RepID=A0ABQ5PXS4_9BACT|nr:hypothetical protein [Geothrix edaphica]GLH67093.1 hypothetical protein GETHED_14570 [Geothrix edaphica]
MAVPALHLNLAPRPSLWRQHHRILGWAALGLGAVFLLGALGLTWRAYHQAGRAGRDAVNLTEETRRAARSEAQIQSSLQGMDATREQARWKLAERILQERSLPWSRVTAELEQCMAPGMRLKGLQRTRGNGQQVMMKLKGEAQSREAEAAFVDALRTAPVFAGVILEREAERQGGGWDFELNLPAAAVPPPFEVRAVKTGPAPTASPVARPIPAAPRPAPAPAPASSSPRPLPPPVPPTPAPTPGGRDGAQARPAPAPGEEEEVRAPRGSRYSRRPPR